MNRPLRIVSVCRTFPTPSDPSGGIFVLNRVAAMAQRADVSVLHAVPYCPGLRPLPAWARDESRSVSGVRIEHAPMFYVPGALKSLDAAWLTRSVAGRIERLHREQPIDLIDAHFGYPEGVGCAAVARRLGIPVFITIRGFEKEFVNRPIIGRRMLQALADATGVVAVSHSLRRFAIEHGIAGDRIRVVHNAIDTRLFAHGSRGAAREALGLDANAPLIVSVGHLIPRKRHNVLIEAFSVVRRTIPGVRLVIIGSPTAEPSHAQSLRSQVAALGLEPHVSLLGNRPPAEVVNWLRAADLFALATAREGCCNAVLEALAVGTPVVTTTAGDNSEFVKPDVSGALVAIDDAEALAKALATALAREDWNRARIAADLHAQVGSWSDVAGRVLDFFESSLRGR